MTLKEEIKNNIKSLLVEENNRPLTMAYIVGVLGVKYEYQYYAIRQAIIGMLVANELTLQLSS